MERARLLIQKYRPKTLDEIVGHDEVREWFKQWLDVKRVRDMPHVLLFGPPGTGKTCFAEAFFRDLVSLVSNGSSSSLIGKFVERDYLELNASDDRGINVIREKVKSFAMRKAMNPTGIKVVFLDEADSMTNDAYEALRRIMEDYESTKFILALNSPQYVHEAIKDRAVSFYIRPLTVDELVIILKRVVQGEGWSVDEEALRGIATAAGGSARRAINLLQSVIVAGRLHKELYERVVANPLGGVERVLMSATSPYHLVLLASRVDDEMLFRLLETKVVEDGDRMTKLLNKYGWRDWESKEIKRAKLLRVLWEYYRGVNDGGAEGSG